MLNYQDESKKLQQDDIPSDKNSKSLGQIFLGIILIGAVIYLAISLIPKQQNKQPLKFFIEECDVFDCQNSVKAVGKLKDASNGHDENSATPKWELQKTIWIFKQQQHKYENEEGEIFAKLNEKNTQYFAEKSNYTIKYYNLENYKPHLSSQAVKKIVETQQILKNRLESNTTTQQIQTQILENQYKILQRLVSLSLLLQNGGIFINYLMTIVEPLDQWLDKIMSVPYINVGKKLDNQEKPQCFGFFDSDFSSFREKVNVKREFQFQRKLTVFPVLLDDFIACQKGSQFLMKWIDAYIEILDEGLNSTRWTQLNKNGRLIGQTDIWKTHRDGHMIASHIVLQQKQAQLNKQSKEASQSPNPKQTQFKNLAIDSYGIVTINKNIALNKMQFIFWAQQKLYSFMSKITKEEMQLLTGKVRFVSMMSGFLKWRIGRHVLYGSSDDLYFINGSFVHQYFLRFLPKEQAELKKITRFGRAPQMTIIEEDPKQNLNNPQWTAIQNNLWVIWDKGLRRHSNPIIQLCYQNLKRSCEASNFTIHIIQKDNIEQFISKGLRQNLTRAIKNANQSISSQTVSDFWRLALIYENGGIYVDASTFTTNESLDWIRNITREPSSKLWNRYGKEPQVLSFWNSLYGSPVDWHYDHKHQTKSQWLLSYESNFIAALKGSQFIKEWLEVFMQWITLPYEEIQRQMIDVGIKNHKWISKENRYLIVMDAVKYVVGRREKILRESKSSDYYSSADYYKIWSLPGQMIGQQKFRGEYNFESRDHRLDYNHQEVMNIYKYEYSMEFAEGLLGSLEYQTKFFGLDLRETGFILNGFYRQNKDHNFTISKFESMIHPESAFGKLLLFKEEKNTMKLLKYYNEASNRRLQLKGVKMIGI